MAEIILIYPQLKLKRIGPPLSLLFLAGELEKRGFEVQILDQLSIHDTKRSLELFLGPETLFVGISSMTGKQLKQALAATALIKSINPEVPIVWGGVHPSIFPENSISHPDIEYIVIGEGEEVIGDLAVSLKQGRKPGNIPGVCYKIDDRVKINPRIEQYKPMDDLAKPAWHHVQSRLKDYLEACDGRLMVQFSRGCPYNCGFCINKVYNLQRHRSMSAERIIEELKFLIERFGINKFDICDDNFLVNKNIIRELHRKLVEINLKVDLQLSARVDVLDEEIIGILSDMGVSKIFLGVESGSKTILSEINKGIDPSKVKKIAHLLPKYNIVGFYSFMFNFPFETTQDILRTKELAEYIFKNDPKARINLNAYHPYPGTDLYKRVKQDYGLVEKQTLEEWSETEWDQAVYWPHLGKDPSFTTTFLAMWRSYFDSERKNLSIIRRLVTYRSIKRFRKNYFVLPLEHEILRIAWKLFH